ncbi:hypothetical protein VPH35_085754 [Triticum aestivum]
MIRALITSQHPKINLTTLYTFLWCLWKARNDCLFCSKLCKPSQVYASANAIIEATNLEDKNFAQQQESDKAQEQLQDSSTTTHTHDCNNLTGNVIFCDAAWERRTDSELGHAGLGVIITMQDNRHLQRLHVSALSSSAGSEPSLLHRLLGVSFGGKVINGICCSRMLGEQTSPCRDPSLSLF